MKILAKNVTPCLLIAFLFFAIACKKSTTTTCNSVPNVAVSISGTISEPIYNPLNAVGGYVVVTGGNRGVIIYRYTTSQMNAFDCVCPYEGINNSKASVTPQTGGVYAKCPVCGSTFLLSDGSVSHGPATCPLKSYSTTFDGSSAFSVSN